jgi:dienelactone hydrolase
MQAALENWLATKTAHKLVLIGFSGGGTLATLLASRLKNISTVVTIAANLDVKAWSDYHGYLQPAGSLNPISDARIPASVHQIHLAGQKDDNVPAKIIESFSQTQKNALFLALPEYGHACCWIEIWPDILKTYLNP